MHNFFLTLQLWQHSVFHKSLITILLKSLHILCICKIGFQFVENLSGTKLYSHSQYAFNHPQCMQLSREHL